MQTKEYILPNGKKAVFEYDVCGIGKITLECMDELMGMIADRPQGEWIDQHENGHGFWVGRCSRCSAVSRVTEYCPECGAKLGRSRR